jgi:hypothetical protein
MNLSCSPAQPEDALAIRLREEDEHEVSLYGLEDPAAALAASIDPASSVAVRDPSGALVAIGGVTQPGPNELSPWLLCSALVGLHRREAWSLAKTAVALLQSRANEGFLVHNHIAKDSVQARRFIQRLGFRIVQTPDSPFDFFYLPCASPSQSPA